MTRQEAYERLVQEYPAGGKFETFFRDLIDRFAGVSSIVDAYTFDQIRRYLHNL